MKAEQWKERADEATALLVNLIKSWEVLPEGSHDGSIVEMWLAGDMAPSVNAARAFLAKATP